MHDAVAPSTYPGEARPAPTGANICMAKYGRRRWSSSFSGCVWDVWERGQACADPAPRWAGSELRLIGSTTRLGERADRLAHREDIAKDIGSSTPSRHAKSRASTAKWHDDFVAPTPSTCDERSVDLPRELVVHEGLFDDSLLADVSNRRFIGISGHK
jgi:hypothetical protein